MGFRRLAMLGRWYLSGAPAVALIPCWPCLFHWFR
jgi:hypothetical protein